MRSQPEHDESTDGGPVIGDGYVKETATATGFSVALLVVSGCAADRLYKAQADLQESSRKSADHALVWRQRFLECVTTYSRTHAKSAQLLGQSLE